MRHIKKLIRSLNDFFILIVLFLFYFIGIGFGSLLYRIFARKKRSETYWQDVKNDEMNFSSY